jgi:hypothetical protein
MQCYSCARQARMVNAVGICQWCGSGVCGEHAREVRQALPLGGLYGMRPVQLVCSRCLATQHKEYASPRHYRQRHKTEGAVMDLPDARAAVVAAEVFLRNQQHTSVPAQTGPWQRVRRWLTGWRQ